VKKIRPPEEGPRTPLDKQTQADFLLTLLQKQENVLLTFYDLCWLLPFANEASIRAVLRDLQKRGHARPCDEEAHAGGDERSQYAWLFSTTPQPLPVRGWHEIMEGEPLPAPYFGEGLEAPLAFLRRELPPMPARDEALTALAATLPPLELAEILLTKVGEGRVAKLTLESACDIVWGKIEQMPTVMEILCRAGFAKKSPVRGVWLVRGSDGDMKELEEPARAVEEPLSSAAPPPRGRVLVKSCRLPRQQQAHMLLAAVGTGQSRKITLREARDLIGEEEFDVTRMLQVMRILRRAGYAMELPGPSGSLRVWWVTVPLAGFPSEYLR